MSRKTALGLILAVSLSLPAYAAEPDGPTTLISRSDAVRIAIQDKLAAMSAKRENVMSALTGFYADPDRKLLWVDDNGLMERSKAIMAEIGKADDYGLRASDYALPAANDLNVTGENAADRLADAEVKISNAVLNYAIDARGGRFDPPRLNKNLDPTLALPDPGEVLGSIAIRSDAASYLRSFHPDQPQFEALRKKLIELRGGAPSETAEPAISVTIPEGPALKLGLQHPQVALLRTRLEVPAQESADETVFDRDVLKAVRQFQSEHGMAPDGVVGAGTRRVLNNPSQPRRAGNRGNIDVILANMERWRWLPHDLGPYYINANIPEFTLRVVEDGKTVHSARVVVGQTNKQTPIFSDEMEHIVFNPNWYVPQSIKTEELAPYLGRGGGFFGGGWDTSVLRRYNLRIRGASGRDIDPDAVDWSRVDIRQVELYQPPGPRNVLGTMKFMFPNKHDVYMHDTVQKHLFANAVRAESHGCMRVQNPDKFAYLLLNRDQGWTQEQVAATVSGRDDNRVDLRQKIPVHMTYFTVRVEEDGSLSTFRDIYGHDARMIAALTGKAIAYEPAVSEVFGSEPRPRMRYRQQRRDITQDFGRALFGF
jgi:murein L,D-transpeptidase YcbB/YkuD